MARCDCYSAAMPGSWVVRIGIFCNNWPAITTASIATPADCCRESRRAHPTREALSIDPGVAPGGVAMSARRACRRIGACTHGCVGRSFTGRRVRAPGVEPDAAARVDEFAEILLHR